jgi:hypothetical protein
MSCGQATSDEASSAGGGGTDPSKEGGAAGSGGFAGSGGSGGGVDFDAQARGDAGGGADASSTGGQGGAGGTGAFDMVPPALFVVHASPDLYDFRVCITADDEVLNVQPLPSDPAIPVPYTNHTGVPVGGALDLTDVLPLLAGTTNIKFHIIDASISSVAALYDGSTDTATCRNLICTGTSSCLGAGQSITFDGFTKSALDAHLVNLLVVEGCRTGTTAPVTLDTSRCGATFNGTDSNLSLQTVGFSPYLTTNDYGITAYAVTLAPTLAAMYPGRSTRLSYGPLDNTDAQTTLINTVTGVPAAADNPPLPLPTEEEDYRAQGLTLDAVGAGDDVQPVLAASWANIAALGDPNALASNVYTSVPGQIFVIVGDATDEPAPWLLSSGDPNPLYDGRGIHILALPLREALPE